MEQEKNERGRMCEPGCGWVGSRIRHDKKHFGGQAGSTRITGAGRLAEGGLHIHGEDLEAG